MLIYIDESIIEQNNIEQIKSNSELLECISNLAKSAINGKHFVFSTKKVLNTLSKIEQLSENDRKTFKKIEGKFSFIGYIMNCVKAYINVCFDLPDNKIEPERTLKDEKTVFNIPLKYLSKVDILSKTCLVSEDLNDCKFYKRLTSIVMRNKELAYFKFDLDNINGGGENTYENYENTIEENKICIAIVDSDKKSINAELGQTAKKLKKAYRKYENNYITFIHELEVREKENLIPINIYDTCYNENDDVKCSLNVLMQIYGNDELKSRYYYGDIKDGLKIDEENEVINFIDENIDTWIEEGIVSPCLVNTIGTAFEMAGYNPHFEYKKEPDINDKKKFIYGISKVYQKFQSEYLEEKYKEKIKTKEKYVDENPENEEAKRDLDNFKKKFIDLDKATSELSPEYKEWWDKIGEMVFSWGCFYQVKPL